MRTSQTHPLQIATLPIGSGAVDVTFCPGKCQPSAMTGAWLRDLSADLKAMADWGCTEVLTLLEPWELDELKVPTLGDAVRAHGMAWHHWPITDGDAPDGRFLEPWGQQEGALLRRLRDGDRLVVHCKGGLGRAGTVATMLLALDAPETPIDLLIQKVRDARPGAIETKVQEDFLQHFAKTRSIG